MKKQYVVFGAGKFGGSIATTLQELDCDVIVVDKNEETVQEIADKVTYALCADVENTETFEELGLRDLDGAVISMTSSLEASIVTTMMCKEMGIPLIIAKAKNQMHEKILRSVGADMIIYPELAMGRRVAKHMVAENIRDWVDLSAKVSLVEMDIPTAWIGRSLVKLELRQKYGLNIIGIKKNDEVQINIDPQMPLPDGVELIVVGDNSALQKLEK